MITAVTGASGHVGACLCRRLLEERRSVRLLVHRDLRALGGLDAERVHVDLEEPESLVKAFVGAEVVYHLAVSISLERRRQAAMLRTNVEGTRNVLSACAAAGVRRLVYFSSIEALSDQPGDAPTVESNPLAEQSETTAYGWSKTCAETLVHEAVDRGLDAVILNPTAIVGPYDFRPSPLGGVLIALSEGRLPVLVEGGFNWVDVRDVAAAAMAAERRGRRGECYLLSGTWLSVLDLARLVDTANGRKTLRVAAPYWAARLGAALADTLGSLNGQQPVFTPDTLRVVRKYRHVSADKARRELGFRPRPLEETIPETLAWFREQGYLKESLSSARRPAGKR